MGKKRLSCCVHRGQPQQLIMSVTAEAKQPPLPLAVEAGWAILRRETHFNLNTYCKCAAKAAQSSRDRECSPRGSCGSSGRSSYPCPGRVHKASAGSAYDSPPYEEKKLPCAMQQHTSTHITQRRLLHKFLRMLCPQGAHNMNGSHQTVPSKCDSTEMTAWLSSSWDEQPTPDSRQSGAHF